MRVLLALPIIVSLAACESGGDRGPAVSEEARSPSARPLAAATDQVPVIAQARSDWSGLTVQLLQVQRTSPATITLRFAFVNDPAAAEPFVFADRFAGAPDDTGSVAGIFLTDSTVARKYFVVRDAEGRPLCSRELPPIEPGERREIWATLPAPSGSTRTITVTVPSVPPFERVALPPESELDSPRSRFPMD